MSFADQLTVARALSVPVVVVLFAVSFQGHDYWGTGVFCAAMATDWFDGRLARRAGRTSPFGSLLDPVADKLLVLATLIVLLGQDVFPAWMVAAIVARELLITGLRQAAVERGIVIAARDLGKLKTWAQAVAAGVGGLAAAGVWRHRRRLVDVAGRARADLGLRARLRPLGAALVPRARGELSLILRAGRGRTARARRRARPATRDPAGAQRRPESSPSASTISGRWGGSSSSSIAADPSATRDRGTSHPFEGFRGCRPPFPRPGDAPAQP